MNFRSGQLKQKMLPEVFSGNKFIYRAISVAHAGSDVFGLQIYAKETKDEKHWIINGTKKRITGGMYVTETSEYIQHRIFSEALTLYFQLLHRDRIPEVEKARLG